MNTSSNDVSEMLYTFGASARRRLFLDERREYQLLPVDNTVTISGYKTVGKRSDPSAVINKVVILAAFFNQS